MYVYINGGDWSTYTSAGSYILSGGPPFLWRKHPRSVAHELQATTVDEAKACLEVIARMG